MNSNSNHYLHSRLLLAATFIGALAFSALANAQSESARRDSQRTFPALPLEQSASRGIITRDPSSIVKCKDEYWVFYTGRGVPSYHSKDLVKWERGPAVFKTAPEWIAKIVPENRNMVYWAPDIIKLGDRYLLYYSVSSFGKMTSAIGLATNPTLDPNDPAYQWTDEGVVVQTKEGQSGEAYNAIDPAAFSDSDGSLWLTFGSYWTGIKLIQLDPKTGKRIAADSKMSSLAFNDSIEAAYICRRDDYYYLFVNWDSCCRGPEEHLQHSHWAEQDGDRAVRRQGWGGYVEEGWQRVPRDDQRPVDRPWTCGDAQRGRKGLVHVGFRRRRANGWEGDARHHAAALECRRLAGGDGA